MTLGVCCFLTVSGPINAILASFDCLVSHLLRGRQGKKRLSYSSRRKSSKNQTFIPIPSLSLSIDQRFSLFENDILVPNIERST